MTQITTTLNKIRSRRPCGDGWTTLLQHLGKTQADDEPLPLVTVLESNGLTDAIWVLRTVPEHDRLWRLYAVWCARQLSSLISDPRLVAVLAVVERFAWGLASEAELAAAGSAAGSAAWAAAGNAAGSAAWAAAWDAAWAAAWAAAWDAAWAAAWTIVGVGVGAAPAAAAREAQSQELRRLFEGGDYLPPAP